MSTKTEIELDRYTIIHDNGHNFHALRDGEPWRVLTGDNLVFLMACEIESLRTLTKPSIVPDLNKHPVYKHALDAVSRNFDYKGYCDYVYRLTCRDPQVSRKVLSEDAYNLINYLFTCELRRELE